MVLARGGVPLSMFVYCKAAPVIIDLITNRHVTCEDII